MITFVYGPYCLFNKPALQVFILPTVTTYKCLISHSLNTNFHYKAIFMSVITIVYIVKKGKLGGFVGHSSPDNKTIYL